jgi:acyl transferase domain-containing protein
MPAEAIDCAEPLNCFRNRLDGAAGLSGELGDWIGRGLPPTLFYDWPSIDAAARYLAGEHKPENSAPTVIDGPIAVVGVACRFPGGDDVHTFWEFLRRGGEAVSGGASRRWPSGGDEPAVQKGSFLPRVDLFDAQFFGIARREAERMDPQQRLLLEVAWEALEERRRLRLHRWPDRRPGSSSAISTADYMRMQVGAFDSYTATGNAFSIAPNRLSYRLDLRGPSIAVDTACSSSLVAVHQACEALRRDGCDLRSRAGVNLVLSPDLSLSLSKAGMLAPDGSLQGVRRRGGRLWGAARVAASSC